MKSKNKKEVTITFKEEVSETIDKVSKQNKEIISLLKKNGKLLTKVLKLPLKTV